MPRDIKFDITDQMKDHLTIIVTPVGMHEYRMRLFLVKVLFWIMAKIAPFEVEWNDGD